MSTAMFKGGCNFGSVAVVDLDGGPSWLRPPPLGHGSYGTPDKYRAILYYGDTFGRIS